MLMFTEGEMNGLIAQIITNQMLPEKDGESFVKMIAYIMTQHNRTMYAYRQTNDLLSRTLTKRMEMHPLSGSYDNRDVITAEQQISERILVGLACVPLMMDLKWILLINNSDVPFITSDNPVVMSNASFAGEIIKGSSTSYSSQGLQIMFPINGKHMIVAYDPVHYIYGDRSDVVAYSSKEDTMILNAGQYLNSDENIYFGDELSDANIKRIVKLWRSKRRKRMANAVEDESGSGYYFYNEDISFRPKVSFMRFTKHRKHLKIKKGEEYYRDEKLTRFIREMIVSRNFADTLYDRVLAMNRVILDRMISR